MTPRKPAIALCKSSPELWMAGPWSCFSASVDSGLFTWLQNSNFLASELVQPSDFLLQADGIYGVFITHPTPGHSTSPCSCQNHPLVPSRVSSNSPRGTPRKECWVLAQSLCPVAQALVIKMPNMMWSEKQRLD